MRDANVLPSYSSVGFTRATLCNAISKCLQYEPYNWVLPQIRSISAPWNSYSILYINITNFHPSTLFAKTLVHGTSTNRASNVVGGGKLEENVDAQG